MGDPKKYKSAGSGRNSVAGSVSSQGVKTSQGKRRDPQSLAGKNLTNKPRQREVRRLTSGRVPKPKTGGML